MINEKTRQLLLVPHDPRWADCFADESSNLRLMLGDQCCAVHHMGSTAVPDIDAKPIIDLLIEVHSLEAVDDCNAGFEQLGYRCMGEFGIPGRRFYCKGDGCHTHHVHLFERGSADITRHLAFRDYLKQHPDTAQAYACIKRCLAEQLSDDVQAYTHAKDSFIRMMTYRAGVAKPDQCEASDDIVIKAYDPRWPRLAMAEMNAIRQSTRLEYVAMHHLGSTSVTGLAAKPTIDIFIALDDMVKAEAWIKPLEALGYDYWRDNPSKTHVRYFKGMPPFGMARTHHVHIMPFADKFKRRLAFRDKLEHDSDLRQQYAALKHHLVQHHGHDRSSYTDAKGAFIAKVLND